MTAASELPLPGETGCTLRDNGATMRSFWGVIDTDATGVTDAAGTVDDARPAFDDANSGWTARQTTYNLSRLHTQAKLGAGRLRQFKRPIEHYAEALDSVRKPIQSLRDWWEQGERYVADVASGKKVHPPNRTKTAAEEWTDLQADLKRQYKGIIDGLSPARTTFVAQVNAIGADTFEEPADVDPKAPTVERPDNPIIVGFPPSRQPTTRQPTQPGNGTSPNPSGQNPNPNPKPKPKPKPKPDDDRTPKEILDEWFKKNGKGAGAIVAAWILLPKNKATLGNWLGSAKGRGSITTWVQKSKNGAALEGWMDSPAGRTSMSTWIPTETAAFDAWLQAPGTADNLKTWAATNVPAGQIPPGTDLATWIKDPENVAFRDKWLTDATAQQNLATWMGGPDNARYAGDWLGAATTQEGLATWVGDPKNTAVRTAWLADPGTQGELVTWIRDPKNGAELAEWAEHPDKIPDPLTPATSTTTSTDPVLSDKSTPAELSPATAAAWG